MCTILRVWWTCGQAQSVIVGTAFCGIPTDFAYVVHLHATCFLFALHGFYTMSIGFSHVLCYIVYLYIITVAHLYILHHPNFIIYISRLIATTANVTCLYPERL